MNAVVRLTHGNEVVLQYSGSVHVAQPAPLHALDEAVHLPGAPDKFVIAEEPTTPQGQPTLDIESRACPTSVCWTGQFLHEYRRHVHPTQLQDAASAFLV